MLAGIGTYNPDIAHVFERDVVAFQIVDRSTGDGVRGEFTGRWPGVVRPMLNWKVEAQPDTLVDEHLVTRHAEITEGEQPLSGD